MICIDLGTTRTRIALYNPNHKDQELVELEFPNSDHFRRGHYAPTEMPSSFLIPRPSNSGRFLKSTDQVAQSVQLGRQAFGKLGANSVKYLFYILAGKKESQAEYPPVSDLQTQLYRLDTVKFARIVLLNFFKMIWQECVQDPRLIISDSIVIVATIPNTWDDRLVRTYEEVLKRSWLGIRIQKIVFLDEIQAVAARTYSSLATIILKDRTEANVVFCDAGGHTIVSTNTTAAAPKFIYKQVLFTFAHLSGRIYLRDQKVH